MRFRAGVSERDKDTILASHGAQRKKYLRGESGIEKLRLTSGRDVQLAALQVLLDPQVEFAEPNFLISKDELTPNDPQFEKQWALRNIGQEARIGQKSPLDRILQSSRQSIDSAGRNH